jgi:DNA-binding MarR family transcriptional regulator
MFTTNRLNVSISIAQACGSADASESTAFRYVKVFIDKGYLERSPHPQDKRIVTLKLSAMGIERVDRWLTRFGDALAKPPNALTC